MLLILQITQLDYGDAALCALSALRGRAEDPGSAASRLLEALGSVPPELIRRLLDAIPDRDKAALAASLARENEARIRELAGEAAHRAGVSLSVKELSVSAGWSSGPRSGTSTTPPSRRRCCPSRARGWRLSRARPRRCCRSCWPPAGASPGSWAVCPRRGRSSWRPACFRAPPAGLRPSSRRRLQSAASG